MHEAEERAKSARQQFKKQTITIRERDTAVSDELAAKNKHDNARKKQKKANNEVKRALKQWKDEIGKNKKALQDAIIELRDCLKSEHSKAIASGGSCNLAIDDYLDQIKSFSGEELYKWFQTRLGLTKSAKKRDFCGADMSCSVTNSCIETISVPVDGSTQQSAKILQKGKKYRLIASGTMMIGGAVFGDAQFAFSANGSNPVDHCYRDPNSTNLGIGIDDSKLGSNLRSPDWGAYNSEHIYVVEFVGKGKAILVNYHDCGYADNAQKNLVVEICK